MAKLIGTDPNQVPSNADLGTMAYQDYDVVAPVLKSGRKNLIINGGFDVNQRGVAFPQTTPASTVTFSVDRWISYGSGISTTVTVQDVTLPDGTLAKSHKTVANSTSASGWLHPAQKIEVGDYLRGKTITLSTWVKTTLSDQKIRLCDTATCLLLGEVIPNDGQWHYIQTTYTLPTNLSGANNIQFHPAWGATSISIGDYIEFALPQVEIGDTATDFEHRSYGEELALCQRYFQIVYAHSVMTHYVGAWGRYYGVKTLPVEMRTNPTPNPKFTRATNYQPGGGSGTSVGIGVPDPSTLDFSWYGNSNGFNDVKFNTADTGDKRIFCDAEL